MKIRISPLHNTAVIFTDAKKQLAFGIASGLTKSAKESQQAVLGAMKQEFTLRGRWYEQSNKFGIKVKPATKTDLTAEIRTAAPWLPLQETGGTKTPIERSALTVPTETTRPPKSEKKLPRRHRLKLKAAGSFILRTGKLAFIAVRKHFQRKQSRLDLYYILERSVRIKPRPFWREPIEKGLQRRLVNNVQNAIADAYRSSNVR
ncbi:MAG: hypothetical protein C4287_23275 [Leptolyngbya sp. ERB_1_2]